MGRAGRALKQVLTSGKISQSRLASLLGVERPIVFRWFHEKTDPTAETVVRIVDALRALDPETAAEFIRLYLGEEVSHLQTISVKSGRQLPDSEQLNIPALSRLLSDTTNSYKYLFLLSILDILNRRQFEVLSPVSFQELIVEMLANAWYPHTLFKLSFGRQDKIAQKLDSLNIKVEEPIIQCKDLDKKLLRKVIASQNLKDAISHLRRYVPFRLITPFLTEELEGISRGKGNQIDIAIPAVADRFFDQRKPLYRFDSTTHRDCKAIIIHPDWAAYLERHYTIVYGWVAWKWMSYMQRRNPSTPAISSKLFAPQKRDSLKKQTEYWKRILETQSIDCIYSQKPINPEDFSLDHYIPWSFIAHDQLWNLIPTSREVNSSKSNNIPSRDYFESFVRLQHKGLMTTRDLLGESQWTRQVEPYITDLNVSCKEDLLDREKLLNAYEQLANPLASIAKNQGFASGWKYAA